MYLKFAYYLTFREAYIRGGLIFGGKFVLVIRGAYIRGGLYSGRAYIRDFTVCCFVRFISKGPLHNLSGKVIRSHYFQWLAKSCYLFSPTKTVKIHLLLGKLTELGKFYILFQGYFYIVINCSDIEKLHRN